MELRTHKLASKMYVGKILELSEGKCIASLRTTWIMAVDSYGLVHGGFTFGLADLAAMGAVNEENVVLVSANVKFLKPVKVGDELIAEAEVKRREGKKYYVNVIVRRGKGGEIVFEGEMLCYVPEKHVLEG